MNIFTLEIAKLNIELVKAHLIKVNLGLINSDGSTPAFFEQLFLNYYLTGIEWQCGETPLALGGERTIQCEAQSGGTYNHKISKYESRSALLSTHFKFSFS